MKQNKNELDVDFIGGNGPLTEEERLTISAYIKAQKNKASVKKCRLKSHPSNKKT